MSYALARRDELNVANAHHENTVADIRNDTIHNIIHTVLRLNEYGERISIHFEKDRLSICIYTKEDLKHIEALGDIYLKTAEQLIDALAQLEEMENASFIDDTVMLFAKEDKPDAEAVS